MNVRNNGVGNPTTGVFAGPLGRYCYGFTLRPPYYAVPTLREQQVSPFREMFGENFQ